MYEDVNDVAINKITQVAKFMMKYLYEILGREFMHYLSP
jgi:hypothetical protein